MTSKSSLTRRLSALEGKATGEPETVCLFVMPGESEEAAVARSFGPAGPPLGAKVVAFTWQPTQDAPEQGMMS